MHINNGFNNFRKLYKEEISKIFPVITVKRFQFKTLKYNGKGSENSKKCLLTYNINIIKNTITKINKKSKLN